MSILMRSGIAAAVLAVFQLGVMHYGKSLPPADIGPTKAKIEAFPLQIGPYEATEATLDEKIFVATQADYMRTLSLASLEGRRASLSLGIWTYFRLGLPDEPYYRLSAIHEFGHFQTLPLMALYSIISGWILIATRGSLLGIVAVLISIHATWEMLAESYVRLRVGRYYAKIYSKMSPLPRLLFWILAGVISTAGWGVWFIRW